MGTRAHKLIVLVDDNEDDRWIIEKAVQRTLTKVQLRVFEAAETALEYLDDERSERPELIVIDAILPQMSGLELVSQLRAEGPARLTPVIMLSGSNQQSLIDEAYARGCNGFCVKPAEFSDLVHKFTAIFDYWLTHMAMPSPPGE